ncbi:histone deacetylase complex subunit SAP130 [Pogonomyrmex barbatus]|uniref:Histone deacetylase complex subunit SAP130 n=1 Tax=Pogonomyrmex barbatus TaxID=144034 RepID=A0A6I9X6R9_9HYME|nr:histone deacetylase complex subunit SAP130 [Pogonomyrmex barbatus]
MCCCLNRTFAWPTSPNPVVFNRAFTTDDCLKTLKALLKMSTVSSSDDKRMPETTVSIQTVVQNLTTMQNVQNVQSVQSVQNVQSVVHSNIQNIQPTQTIVGSVGIGNLVGKSVSLDMNPKLSLMKPVVPSGAISSTETSKITTTVILFLIRTTPISNPQWQPKTSVAIYAQSPRHPTPPISRISRPQSVYAGQQQRLITPNNQGRSLQASMVTGSSSRLITPILPTNSNITRLPVAQNRPSTSQVVTVSQTTQASRSSTQSIQPIQSSRLLSTTGTTKRITVPTPIVETANRISSTASVTLGSVESTVGRQLSINTVAVPSTVGHIVIPSQVQQQQQGAPRVVQTVTSLSNLTTVSQIITTANTHSNTMRILQTAPTTVAKITGMSLHPLPISLPVRAASAPIKTAPVQAQNIGQTVQIKPAQQANLRMSSTNSSTTTSSAQPVQGQYIHPPHTTTYLSFETSGTYSQFRQAAVQPVRLVVEPGYEEPHSKPNASPRPSILRKRDHDNSPIKGAAKNLVPVLAALPSSRAMSSPPCSPKGDQDGGGCQSSGSTTVSATSSPGLDEEPEQSRITINPTIEMSPRKKPRKQQLTGVELTEPRCTEEEMQFLTDEKIKKEGKEESKEKLSDKRQISNVQSDIKSSTQQTEITIRTRPVPSLLGSWKNKWTVRLHHYRRPSDVRPREERRPTVAELAQQKHVLQKLNGWKIYHLTTQMEDIAELEKQVHEKLKTTLMLLESQQTGKNRHNDGLERVNELIKGNMQRSNLISEGMIEARTQLVAIFQHKDPITDLLQRCGNKRAQKKREK